MCKKYHKAHKRIKRGEFKMVNGNIEEMKTEYNEENYQNVR